MISCIPLSAAEDYLSAGFDCRAGHPQAVAIVDEDVYSSFGDRIKRDVGTAADAAGARLLS